MRSIWLAFLILGLAAGACSADPTASNEYQALAQELAGTQAQLAAVTVERDALLNAAANGPSGDAVSVDVGQGTVPSAVVAIIDQWKAATEDSLGDLYTTDGFHLYGDFRYRRGSVGAHLVNPSVGHEQLTPLILIAQDNQRWVVTQGFKNTVGSIVAQSSLSWEVVETAPGELQFAQTAWFKKTG